MRKLSDTDIMEMFIQPKNVTMCQDIEAAFIHGEDSLDELCRIRYGVLDLHNGTLFITGKDQGDTFIFYVKCQDRGCFTQCFWKCTACEADIGWWHRLVWCSGWDTGKFIWTTTTAAILSCEICCCWLLRVWELSLWAIPGDCFPLALRGKGRPDVEGAMPEPILPVVFGLLPPSVTLLTGIAEIIFTYYFQSKALLKMLIVYIVDIL